jgi:glyoxylase I family protein
MPFPSREQAFSAPHRPALRLMARVRERRRHAPDAERVLKIATVYANTPVDPATATELGRRLLVAARGRRRRIVDAVELLHQQDIDDDRRRRTAELLQIAHDFDGDWKQRPVSVRAMPIKFENVGIAVDDIESAIAFFTDLGLTVIGRDTVSGEWADIAVGLDGNHAKIAMLQTPDGSGRLELFEYIHPEAISTEPTLPNEVGMHRVAFSVDDLDEALAIAARHGCHPVRGVATYADVYRLTYLRGPSGILVMLAEELQRSGS